MFLFHGFVWGSIGLKNLSGGPNQNIRGGVKPNDYSITVLDRGGSSQIITVDYNRGRGV